MKKTNIYLEGILCSLGVLAYVACVSWLISNGSLFFGSTAGILGAIFFLMLFVLSAALMGLLVFGRPVILFLNGVKKEAVGLLVVTLGGLCVETAIILVITMLVYW